MALRVKGTRRPDISESSPRHGLRLGFLAPVAVLAVAGLWLWIDGALAPEALAQRAAAAAAFVEARPVLAAAAFVLLYVAATLALAPGVLWLTVGAGAMFGAPLAAALTYGAALAGSTALFLLTRTALGGALARRATGWAVALREGFARGAFGYLLALRLLPFAPYFAVNLAPALLGVRLRTFVLATALGMPPGIILYAVIGQGLAQALREGAPIDLSLALRPDLAAAFAALALIAAAPSLLRSLRHHAPWFGAKRP